MSRLALMPAALLLAAGCFLLPGPRDQVADDTALADDTGSAGDTDPVDDTGPVDTDTDDPGGGGSGDACSDYAGFGSEGSSRTYGTTPEWELEYGTSGTWTYTTDDIRADGTVILDYSGDYVSSASSHLDGTYTYRCSAGGVNLVSYHLVTTTTVNGSPWVSQTEGTYSPALRVWVPGSGPGDTWVSAYTVSGTSTTTYGTTPFSTSGSISYQVGGTSTVTVPAGTFDALELMQTSLVDGGGTSTSSTWMHRKRGAVKGDSMQLEGWSP